MGNYLKMVDKQRILALLSLGWSYRRVERTTGIRRETVARYDPRRGPAQAPAANPANLSTGSGVGEPVERLGPGPQPVAAPYRAAVEAGLARGLTAQRIWQDLREEYGYAHSSGSVRRFVRALKRARPEVADVLEHPPGEEAQVDFFRGPPTFEAGRGEWRRPWIFRMTLACSRHAYTEPAWTQERTPFLRAHERAFAFFGGVPRVVRHDNLKAAVVRACLYDPDVNAVYAAFAAHWGFVPLPSRPRHPQENGVAERGGGYVKDNALKGRRFESLAELAAFLERWNRTVAQLRIHGTTRRQVIRHFLEAERPALRPLPAAGFALFEAGTRTVHPDGHVQVAGAYYSVPHGLVGQEVRAHWDDRLVRLYALPGDSPRDGAAERCVAVHVRRPAGAFATEREHRPAHKPAQRGAHEAGLLAKLEHVGPRALAWAAAAVRERDVRAYRLLQGVVALTRRHPRERVDWACGVALDRGCFRYQTLRRLVEQAAARAPAPGPAWTQAHACIRDLAEYAALTGAPRPPPGDRP